MKYCLALIWFWISFSCRGTEGQFDAGKLKIIETNSDRIAINVDDRSRDLDISSSEGLNQIVIACAANGSKLSLVTDIDSLIIKVYPRDTLKVGFVLKKDTIFFRVIAVQKNVNFNEHYKEEHSGKIDVSVPEVSELSQILIAISQYGRTDSNMINMKGEYYHKVIRVFDRYKDEPIIRSIDSIMEKRNWAEKYWLYYALKMNAGGYHFNRMNKIESDSTVFKIGFDNYYNPIEKFLPQIQAFADKTNFRRFYKSNKSFYDSLVNEYWKLNPVKQMKTWLESQFPKRYDYFWITFSPLTYGAHSTNRFSDNDFRAAYMFVSQPGRKYKTQLENVIENSRIVFTEIDHDYVNPISYEWRIHIERVFSDRKKWVNDSSLNAGAYESPMSVFDEYMTWAVFFLYCADNYQKKDIKEVIDFEKAFMEKRRGFIRFSSFCDALLAIYNKHQKNKKVCDLYPEMLKWCASQE